MTRFRLPAVLVSLVAFAAPAVAAPTTEAEAAFGTRVLPLLKAKCLACHGEDVAKLKGGLDLTSRAALLKGGDSGQHGGAAKAADSPLYKAVTRTDADFAAMPPKENDRLTAEEVKAIGK